jgi:hypothetical protein
MDIALWHTLASQLSQTGSRITFCGMGTPLLHPQLEEIAAISSEFNLRYGLTIQAPALTDENLHRIALLRPAFIEVSFPTLDPAVFSTIFPGEDLQMSITGVRRLIEARNSAREITITAVVTAAEKMTETEIKNYWNTFTLNCRVFKCHSRGGNLKDVEMLNSEPMSRSRCGLFATHSFVTWEGMLLACCHDLTGATAIADLNKTSVIEAGMKKLQIANAALPWEICRNCDEPAADRSIPDRNYPDSAKAKSRYLRNLSGKRDK